MKKFLKEALLLVKVSIIVISIRLGDFVSTITKEIYPKTSFICSILTGMVLVYYVYGYYVKKGSLEFIKKELKKILKELQIIKIITKYRNRRKNYE